MDRKALPKFRHIRAAITCCPLGSYRTNPEESDMTLMKTTLKVASSALAMSALTSTAFATDFNALDANADGQVDFTEYKAVALTEGKTVTLAAQEFTRMAQGDAVLTEDEFVLASAFVDQPYALQPSPTLEPASYEPMPFDPVETVKEVETFESYPEGVEKVRTPEQAAPEDVIPDEVLDITPIEEGETDLQTDEIY